MEAPSDQLDNELKSHLKACNECEGDPAKPDFKRCPRLVELVQECRMNRDRVEAWRRENRAPDRWCYVD